MRVLITGAAGRIGSLLGEALAERFTLTLTDLKVGGAPAGGLVSRDITIFEEVRPLLDGQDAVVHLAGHPNSSDWDVVSRLNVDGTLNVLRAAAEAGVRRFVYASSIHAVGLHPADARLADDMADLPDSPYGVSKAIGEAMLAYFCRASRMSGVALRICSFRPAPTNARELRTWISPGDMVRLVEAALTASMDGCLAVWGVSNNRRAEVDRDRWASIGYEPQDDAESFAPMLAARGVDTTRVSEWPLLGGAFVPEAVLRNRRD